MWWATTKLHRPELPHAAMQAVVSDVSPHAAMLPITFEVYALATDGAPRHQAMQRGWQTMQADNVSNLPCALLVACAFTGTIRADGLPDALTRHVQRHMPALLQVRVWCCNMHFLHVMPAMPSMHGPFNSLLCHLVLHDTRCVED